MSDREKIALYEFAGCPFCARVRSFLASIGEAVESRDITLHREHLDELVDATGRRQVPCLRIEGADGDVRWMLESADIISYLKTYFAKS